MSIVKQKRAIYGPAASVSFVLRRLRCFAVAHTVGMFMEDCNQVLPATAR
ncbi:MAG: hypothetical protein Q7W02_27975 [Candidatus Rokubacteria bacterium]|nr:hypothetical protein [Candidatus Rokubacteria bacterium]